MKTSGLDCLPCPPKGRTGVAAQNSFCAPAGIVTASNDCRRPVPENTTNQNISMKIKILLLTLALGASTGFLMAQDGNPPPGGPGGERGGPGGPGGPRPMNPILL